MDDTVIRIVGAPVVVDSGYKRAHDSDSPKSEAGYPDEKNWQAMR